MKTCTTQQHGNWICWIMRSTYAAVPGGKRRSAYAHGQVDVLAVVDGDLQVHLIDFQDVAGKTAITLRAFDDRRAARLVLAHSGGLGSAGD